MRWTVGDITITRIQEVVYPEYEGVLPAATPEVVKKVKWLFPHFVTAGGHLNLSIHSLIVETPEAVLVVDTCIGNGRDRSPFDEMHMLSTSYLEDMIATGYLPSDVDYVLCTHLHLDHVGWNTQWVNGRWVPTFPNAKYLMDKHEFEYWGSFDATTDDDSLQVQHKVHEDSIQPVLDAGLGQLIEAPTEVCPGVRLISTPGHTPGHCSVLIESAGQSALITGDIMHHPIQFNDPKLTSPFDVDSGTAIATRQRIFGEYADTPTLIIGTHFAGPTGGKLVRDGDTFRLQV